MGTGVHRRQVSTVGDAQGYVNSDRRAAFAYLAIGMSPAMADKIVGGGSQYLSTPRDFDDAFLDGAKNYRLTLPANIPVRNFWSVVVYDAESRSMLKTGQKFPSVRFLYRPGGQRRRLHRHPFRAPRAGGQGEELDRDRARPGLVCPAAFLRSAGALLRQELEARRHQKAGIVIAMMRAVFLVFILVALLGIIAPSLTLADARGAPATDEHFRRPVARSRRGKRNWHEQAHLCRLLCWVSICIALLQGSRRARADPLASWNDGAAKRGILAFVAKATGHRQPLLHRPRGPHRRVRQ